MRGSSAREQRAGRTTNEKIALNIALNARNPPPNNVTVTAVFATGRGTDSCVPRDKKSAIGGC